LPLLGLHPFPLSLLVEVVVKTHVVEIQQVVVH
jgi:hypothetical protein